MSRATKALIVGGDVAGPGAAMALRQAGIDSVVYEAYAGGADGAGGDTSFTGYEADSLRPYTAYLGLGFAAALLYAASRAYRRQHRGLTLASMAVGLATTLQCIAWLIDIPGAAERETGNPAVGVWIGLLGALLWTIGSALLAKEPEGDPEHDRVHTDRDSGYRAGPGVS